MPTEITGSSNIATLDSVILADLCDGSFTIDVTDSVWIGSGASNVYGASVKITNPYGVVIKNYPTSGYDIYPPMTGNVDVNIPTQANNYQYGSYVVDVALTDSTGTIYYVSKSVSICAPNPKNKTVKFGSLSATLDGDCETGKVTVIADTPPTYKGNESDSQVNDFTLEYPTSSGKDVLETEQGSFSATLFEGVYKFAGTICAHYSLGDNVFANVNYKVKREKNIRCLLDKSCIAARLAALQGQLESDCTDQEKIDTQQTIIQTLLLVSVIDGLAKDGQDPSDYIDKLEDVLGCVCTCNCADGTPIINSNPTGDFLIEGCNVTSETADLTTTYTINNYVYTVAVASNGGAITITAPILNSCTQTQTITFNIDVVYAQIKAQIVNTTEYNYWASVVSHTLDSLDISCLNITQYQWNNYTFSQRIQVIMNGLCLGGSCDAEITAGTVTNTAADVTVTWNNISGVYQVAAYLDGILAGTVLSPIESFKFVGAADGDDHTWTLVAKCTNGSIGNSLNGSFNYFGCPTVAVLSVSSQNVTGADCPYDLTSLINVTPPLGIVAEWHNKNNTLDSSLVAAPTQATTGTYYLFAKNSNACYSTGVQVKLACTAVTSCTAPQNLIVEAIDSGFRVRFQTAAYPPPANSYTVKRRLKSSPDIDGSYTTIGTPTWNATVSMWEILDATAIDNTLYTYRAISNCTSSAPYINYDFANLDCPDAPLTPADNSVSYFFTNAGGGIDKYEVSIYEADESTLIHTNTHVPAFSSPITGSFLYLTPGVVYAVRLKVFIGTYTKTCAFVTTTTTGGDDWTIYYTNNNNAVPLTVQIGNNNAAPSTNIYSGNYTSDPLTNSNVNLPAVNANVVISVGAGKTIVTATLNGVTGTGTGATRSWSAVNGSLIFHLTTD